MRTFPITRLALVDVVVAVLTRVARGTGTYIGSNGNNDICVRITTYAVVFTRVVRTLININLTQLPCVAKGVCTIAIESGSWYRVVVVRVQADTIRTWAELYALIRINVA
jgi:hypothetical protein